MSSNGDMTSGEGVGLAAVSASTAIGTGFIHMLTSTMMSAIVAKTPTALRIMTSSAAAHVHTAPGLGERVDQRRFFSSLPPALVVLAAWLTASM